MNRTFPVNTLTAMMLLALSQATFAETLLSASAETTDAVMQDDDFVEFNSAFLSRGSAEKIDLTRYGRDLPASGSYYSNIMINGKLIGHGNVVIKDKAGDDKKVAVCITRNTLSILELNYSQLSPQGLSYLNQADKDDCIDITEVLAGAPATAARYDANSLSLELNLPQILREDRPRGYINPALWDEGITSATLGYSANYNHSRGKNRSGQDSFFSYLKGGVNIGGFYFRHEGTYRWHEKTGDRYHSLNNYVEKDIPKIQGRITLGDAHTRGDLFDTLSFRGVKLENEEQMLPQSMRGYAPVIRGNARTTAKVVVSQSGQVLYEKTVAPGPFEINDLYPTGFGGNLDVRIEEEDGSLQTFQVPYSAMAALLRPNTHKYTLTYGKVRKDYLASEPEFVEATYMRGMTNDFSLYGGFQANNHYQAYQGGIVLGTLLGSFSFDVTHANSKLEDNLRDKDYTLSGQSYQLRYSQNITSTGSNFSLAAYRFSTDNYLDFVTAADARTWVKRGVNPERIRRPKSRVTLTANQTLPEGYGQLYVSAYAQNYWSNETSERQYQFGYSNNYQRLNYSLNLTRLRNAFNDYENTYQLNLSLPIGKEYIESVSLVGFNVARTTAGNVSQNLYVNGSVGDEYAVNYGLTASRVNRTGGSSLSLSASTKTPYVGVSGVASYNKKYQTYGLGLTGAIIAHSGGVTLTPYSADTYGLVEAKGAAGAKVSSYQGVYIDHFGYAVVPYLSAYQMNQVTINPKGMADTVELNETSQKVAPHKGAVVKLKYNTTTGYPVLITAKQAGGQPVPFGSDVYDQAGNRVGVVGQNASLFARVPNTQGQLRVSWGESANQQCHISYVLPKNANFANASMVKVTSVCQ